VAIFVIRLAGVQRLDPNGRNSLSPQPVTAPPGCRRCNPETTDYTNYTECIGPGKEIPGKPVKSAETGHQADILEVSYSAKGVLEIMFPAGSVVALNVWVLKVVRVLVMTAGTLVFGRVAKAS
jgi:hypothetical protein